MQQQRYTEEQVYTRSEEDGVLLAGVVTRPAEEATKPIAFVFIHGYPISATLPFTTNIGRAPAGHGYTFVAANTRGHDIGTWLFRRDGQLMLGGAWWELFDESPRDLAGWISFAEQQQGFRGVVLVGHSFGALKVVYYQAEQQDPRVLGVVVAAPVMRPHAWGSARRPTPERTQLAERMVSEGRGLDLLPWDPYGEPHGTVSAQTYLSCVQADNLDLFGLDTPDAVISKVRDAPTSKQKLHDRQCPGGDGDYQLVEWDGTSCSVWEVQREVCARVTSPEGEGGGVDGEEGDCRRVHVRPHMATTRHWASLGQIVGLVQSVLLPRTQFPRRSGNTLVGRRDTHPVIASVAVSGVGRDNVAHPSEQTSSADPQPRRDDQPQNAGQDAAVVELPYSGDDRAKNRCQSRITHR
jgi:pimeloyl-ACP methyl ester carboxylesterase